jgi:hypothetical protein
MNATHWKRLRLIEAARETDQEILLRLAEWITEGRDLSADDRRRAASYLRRLAESPRALKAITSAGRGRRRDSKYPHIALDYLVQRELRGPRRWKLAQSDVADAWCVSPDTVADAWTDCQAAARWRLQRLVDDRLPTRRGRVVRRDMLEDVSADLREIYGPAARRK